MASSSRAKKQRTSMAHKKKGTSSSEANPLDLARLLANDEQRKVFTEHFLGRPIFARKYGNHNLEINWALTVMNHMWSMRETNIPLPYAIIISNILEHFGVSTVGESKITLNARDRKFDGDVIHKMDFFRDLTDRVYKHRSDRPTAPVDPTANVFINPLELQPCTFQFESSSSAQIPSNQMIMDELFSLRGYISNQIDALDAQN
ncbi:hypothetical protein Lal_00032288 [Lupinus albus]|nr:hypothetical protein Lal_00032288 [Lupinus albus]